MSPTVFRKGKYRGFFFSREEPPLHVHLSCPEGEAKFRLEPIISLAMHTGLRDRDLARMQQLVQGNRNEIVRSWKAHFGGS